MPIPLTQDAVIPVEVEQALMSFGDTLRAACGPCLISAILYGSLAKGGYVRDKSDVNVLLVFAEITPEILDRIRPGLDQARRQLPLTVLTLTETDLADAVDVFSVKFLDIQRHHRVLFGRDVVADLKVTPERLRRQCTRELVNLHWRLRQAYLQRSHRPEWMEGTLIEVLSPFLTNLAVLLELKTGRSPATPVETVSAADQLNLDRPLLESLLALKRGELKPDATSLKGLYAGFLRTVQQAGRLSSQVQSDTR